MKNLFFLTTLLFFGLSAKGQISFEERSDTYEVDHTYQSGLSGGGISTVDFNQDGLPDLSMASSSGVDFYASQTSSKSFLSISLFGLQLPDKVKQILWLDFNKDDHKDLFVSSEDGVRMFYNLGDLHFIDVTDSLGFSDFKRAAFGVAVADVDLDGWLDLYITEKELVGAVSNHLLLNQQGVSFVEVTEEWQISDPDKKPYVPGFFDFDNDHYPDLYIAQDRMAVNSIFRNISGKLFEDISLTSNANETMDGMSISLIDLNQDGYQDFYVSNIEDGNKFFLNKRDLTFHEVADSLSISYNGIAWGTNFMDLDNDGDEDLYVAGSLTESSYQNAIYENTVNGFGVLLLPEMLEDTAISYSSAYADFNQDGRLDVVVNNAHPYRSVVWENTSGAGNWLKVRLHGKKSNSDAIGSHVVAFLGDSRTSKYTMAGEGYLAQNTEWLHFGLGEQDKLDSLWVVWPKGDTSRYYTLLGNQTYDFIEPNQLSWLYEKVNYVCEYPFTLRAGYAASYLWSNGDTSAELHVNEPGLYVLQTMTLSGDLVIDSVNIRQNDPISFDISITQNPCVGAEKASVSIIANQDYTVLWDDGYIGSTRDQLTAATYPLYIYDEVGCGVDTTVTVTSIENIEYQAFIRQIASEELEALVIGGEGPYQYSWVFEMDTVSTEKRLFPTNTGIYELIVIDSLGCIASFKYNYLGAQLSLERKTVHIFPVPFSNTLSINSTIGPLDEVEIFDLQGKRHFYKKEPTENRMNVLMEELSAGLYIIRIRSNDNIYYERIFKE